MGWLINWKLLLVAGAAVSIGGLSLLWKLAAAERDVAQAQLDQLKAAHTSTLAALDTVRRDRDRQNEIIIEEAERRQHVEAENRSLQNEIDAAPNDGCVGTAVNVVIDRLRTIHKNSNAR